MAEDSVRGPPLGEAPGAWPQTPADELARPPQQAQPPPLVTSELSQPILPRTLSADTTSPQPSSLDRTAVPSRADSRAGAAGDAVLPASAVSSDYSDDDEKNDKRFEAINPTRTTDSAARAMPAAQRTTSGRQLTEAELFKALSRRRTNASGREGSAGADDGIDDVGDRAEIERLMSRMFGAGRQAHSEEEKTRHVGLIFKHLTVKGVGLGAALQPTTGDILLGLPRLLKGLFTRGPRGATAGKPPTRTILNDFSGCVKPGEMLLVLGRPGSGCSTFLKVLGNQRFGYQEITGDVTYGGTSHQEMARDFRGDVLYNPEDDLHYPTLTVQETLTFALRTRTPGKASRQEGESRADYVREFLRVVSKLFWIEHTMATKVGDAFIRGVSGGEKKRYVTRAPFPFPFPFPFPPRRSPGRCLTP